MKGRLPLGALFLALVVTLLVGHPQASSPPGSSTTVVPGVRLAAATVPAICANPARRGFWPTRSTVQYVNKGIHVLWVGRYSNGVPKPPPLTTSGKNSFGWDKKGPKPGSHKGNVRFNAHTYPDGSALGNRMLAHLWVGQLIVVRNSYGKGICYRVSRRIEVTPRSWAARVGYYNTTGKPKLAIVVCSGTRLGPGNWTKRTIWYAKPSIY
jgi:hypothetical protein